MIKVDMAMGSKSEEEEMSAGESEKNVKESTLKDSVSDKSKTQAEAEEEMLKMPNEESSKKKKKTKKSSVDTEGNVSDENKTQAEVEEGMSKMPNEGTAGKKKKKTKKSSVDTEGNASDESITQAEVEEEIPKMPSEGISSKKKKKTKRSSVDTEGNVLDGSNSSTEAKEAMSKVQDRGASGKKRKKIKTSSGSDDTDGNVLDAHASSMESGEELQTNSEDGAERKKKKKLKTSESEDSEETAKSMSSTPIKKIVASENISLSRDTMELKHVTDESITLAKKPKIPMFTDPRLPFGWRRECIKRKTGKTEGHYDVYIFSPAGKKFRSRVELARFLASENSDLDSDNFDFSIYGRVGFHSNIANKKKIKSILEMSYSGITSENKDVKGKSETLKAEKLPESVQLKRTSVNKVRKSKEKIIPTLPPKKKARFKYTPTVDEIFKCTSKDRFCFSCGKKGCKFPRVVVEHPPRPLDLLVKEGIKYR